MNFAFVVAVLADRSACSFLFFFFFFAPPCFQLLTFEEARAALASTEYPLFVQLCRPPLVFVTEPAYPVVKLLCNLVLTNRSVEKVDGEFRCDVFDVV